MTITSAIITAGGIGRRMGGTTPKQFLPLAGVPVLVHTINAFQRVPAIDEIILVVPSNHIQHTQEILQQYDKAQSCRVIAGGRLRQDSVKAGMLAANNSEYVVVHDGVRPLISKAIIEDCIDSAKQHGAAITAIQAKDTLKSVQERRIVNTVDRSNVWQAQTPQSVRRDILEKAYTIAERNNFKATDEASLLENAGFKVAVVNGAEKNLKITHPEDLVIAEALLMENKTKSTGAQIRIGHGYDAHKLVEERKLILGGVEIPHSRGLLGHSDADVLTHALCDAMLGAAGAGDIGRHFPDSDPQYKGIESIKLLRRVAQTLSEKQLILSNADITIVAQKPKLAAYLEEMRHNLATACNTETDAINIKATTTEAMGFTGRQEGISCHAVVLLRHDS